MHFREHTIEPAQEFPSTCILNLKNEKGTNQTFNPQFSFSMYRWN